MATMTREDIVDAVANLSAIENADLSGLDLGGTNLGGGFFENCDFSRADLTNANVDKTEFEGCRFANATLDGLRLERARWMETDLRGVKLRDGHIKQCFFDKSDFSGADLSGSYFGWNIAMGVCLDNARLCNARIEKTIFDQAKLHDVDFTGSRVERTSFNEAVMSGLIFATRFFFAVSCTRPDGGTIFRRLELSTGQF